MGNFSIFANVGTVTINGGHFVNSLPGESLPGSQALHVQRGIKRPSGSNRSSPPYPSPAANASGVIVPGKANKKNSVTNSNIFKDSSRHREECYAAILERENLLSSLARNFLYTFVGYFAFQGWYLKRYSSTRISNVPRSVGNPNDHFRVVTESNQYYRWEITVARITLVWDLVRMGGTLSVPLPIALLQLPVAFGNTMLRTMAILAFLLAASSLISASFFIASKEHLLTSAAKRERWINASICPKLFPSIDFWLCLSWPVTSFVWSVSLSCLGVISLATISEPDPSSIGANNDVAPTLVTFLMVTLICVISYRILKFLWRNN